MKRNRANLIIAAVGAVGFVGLTAFVVWASYNIPVATVPTPNVSNETQMPSAPVEKQKVHHKTKQEKQEKNEAGAQKYRQPASSEMRAAEARSLKTQDGCQAAGYFWDVMHDECRSNN
jgi:hypothetical protein